MLLHVFQQVFKLTAKEPQMPQLVHLIKTNRCKAQGLLQACQVSFAGCHYCNSAAREGDFRSRCEHIANIFVTNLLCFFQQVCLYRRIIDQMVYTICIIPENPEICCLRLQCCKPLYHFIAIYNPARIGVHRHAPDTLDAFIFCNQLFYDVHIRAIFVHRHIDQFHAKELRYCKMAVISRNRTQELHMIQFAPRCTTQNAIGHCNRHYPVHNVQAGVSIYNNLFRLYAQHRCKECLCFRQSIQNPIVPAVQTVFSPIIALLQAIHHIHAQFQLCWCWLPSGHIQFQIFCLKLLVCLLTFCLKCLQLCTTFFL